MGKGDIKTKKGKRHIGSYGKHRPRKGVSQAGTAKPQPKASGTAS